ncbi:hypothetical protein ACFL6I_13940 [candidate division KSB1 bacterium]
MEDITDNMTDEEMKAEVKKVIAYSVDQYKAKTDDVSRSVAITYIRKYRSDSHTKEAAEEFADEWLAEELSKCNGKSMAESKPFYDAIRIIRDSGMGLLADNYIIKKAKEEIVNH